MNNNIDRVCVVLAATRTGSTLLCQDIEKLGGLGAPQEYLLPLVRNTGRKFNQNHVLKRIQMGVSTPDDNVCAVKLMVNYAPTIYRYLYGVVPGNTHEAVDGVLKWLRQKFLVVNVVGLIRSNMLDTAISRIVARTTKVYHAVEERTSSFTANPASTNRDLLRELPVIANQNRAIADIVRHYGDIAMCVDYESLASNQEQTLMEVVRHARSLGFATEYHKTERALKKIVDKRLSLELKASFKCYLEQNLQLW